MKVTSLVLAASVMALITSPVMADNHRNHDRHVTKTENGRDVTGSVETKNGTATYENHIEKTGEGTWSSDRTVTGADGTVRKIHTEGERTENGFEKHQTWTNKEGEERTRNLSVTNNPDGTVTRTVTTPNGKTHSMTMEQKRKEWKKRRQGQ